MLLLNYLLSVIKYSFLFLCIVFFCIQSYEEINIYLQKEIFTTTSIEHLEEGHMTLTFCGFPPVLQKNITLSDLEQLLVRPVSKKIKLKKIRTMYRGACLNIEADFAKLVEENYLYYDWGKRFNK